MPRVNRVSGHIRLIVILDHSEISTPVSIVLKMQELGTAGYCSYKKMKTVAVLWRCWLGIRKGIQPVKSPINQSKSILLLLQDTLHEIKVPTSTCTQISGCYYEFSTLIYVFQSPVLNKICSLHARCPSCLPTNSIEALKEVSLGVSTHMHTDLMLHNNK